MQIFIPALSCGKRNNKDQSLNSGCHRFGYYERMIESTFPERNFLSEFSCYVLSFGMGYSVNSLNNNLLKP